MHFIGSNFTASYYLVRIWTAEYISPNAPFPIFLIGTYLFAILSSRGEGKVVEAVADDVISSWQGNKEEVNKIDWYWLHDVWEM